jgi:hypothetical protein
MIDQRPRVRCSKCRCMIVAGATLGYVGPEHLVFCDRCAGVHRCRSLLRDRMSGVADHSRVVVTG